MAEEKKQQKVQGIEQCDVRLVGGEETNQSCFVCRLNGKTLKSSASLYVTTVQLTNSNGCKLQYEK